MFHKLRAALFCLILLQAVPALAEAPLLLPAADAEGRWGYVDAASGEMVVAPRYSRAGMFHNGAAVVHLSFPQAAYSSWDDKGELTVKLPRGDGLIDAGGKDILPTVDSQFISPASPYADAQKAEPRILPGLYVVQNFSGRGVFDVQNGWVLELGPNEEIRFMPDGSFTFNGNSYISAAPERNIYFAPGGRVIAEVELATRSFVLEDAAGSEALGVALWSGEMLSKTSYRSIRQYGACARWAAMTLGGRLDVFDLTGEILRGIGPEFRPQMSDNGEITLESGGDPFIFDPCSLKDIPAREYARPPAEERLEPELQVVLRDGRALLLDRLGSERIAPRYEILLPAGYGYWWGRLDDTRWVLVDSRDGKEIRMP